mmetsp:Transcript_121993/g.350514  ORF Transcript_121993/g.350514 Transcript_121993/m.350514 type:complete len:272 (-) Transcript_121993:165-980(-)
MCTSEPLFSRGRPEQGTSSQKAESGKCRHGPPGVASPASVTSAESACLRWPSAALSFWCLSLSLSARRGVADGSFFEELLLCFFSFGSRWWCSSALPEDDFVRRLHVSQSLFADWPLSSLFSRRRSALCCRTSSSSMRSFAFSVARACSASKISPFGSAEGAWRSEAEGDVAEESGATGRSLSALSCASSFAFSALTWFSSFACSLASRWSTKYCFRQALIRAMAWIVTAARRRTRKSRRKRRPRTKAWSVMAQRRRRRSMMSLFARTLRR